jgi:hypothetical protein
MDCDWRFIMFIELTTRRAVSLSQIRAKHPDLSIGDNADVTHVGYAIIEPTARPEPGESEVVIAGDPEECAPGQWRETWTVQPKSPEPVPEEVTALQGLRAIKQAGLVASFLTWKSDLDPIEDFDMLAFFEKAPTWRRDNPYLIQGATALGLTDAQLDNLFALAATL